jgi:hypothetical protein
MKTRSRIIVALGILLGLPIVALAVVPIVFRDRIVQRVKDEINRTVDARVDWRTESLGLFRSFPNLTLSLGDFSVVGVGRFPRDTLASGRQLGVVLDLASVVRSIRGGGSIVVRAVDLDRPRLALRVLEDGTANWDIAKKTSGAKRDTSQAVAVTLKRLDIRNASVSLDDRQTKLVAAVHGYRQSLSGDFAQDAFLLQTTAHADSVSLRFAGIPYLNHVALDLTADVDANTKSKRFAFRKNQIRLNDLALAFAGSLVAGDPLSLDVAFSSPRTEFRHILSLVPAIYLHDFQSVRTSGAVAVSGHIKGQYGKTAFPSFAVDAKVTNGAFQYPDLPLPARDIALELAITNPGGSSDSTVVRLDRFHAAIGAQPIDGALVLRTPVSDPDVDLRLTGNVDLADVRKTVKLTDVRELAGRVAADVAVRTRMSYVDQKQYDRVAARGTISVSNLALKSADLPHPLAIDEASLQLTPQRADLRSLTGRIGSSDVRLAGYLDNVVPFALRGDPLRGSATFSSRHFDLNEWQSSNDTLEIIPVPGNIDFALQASVAELLYGKLTMTDARGGLRVKDRRATLDNFTVRTLGGEIGVSGFYETTNVARPTFDIDLTMKAVDIPAAFAALTTVQQLAPIARYAQGRVSTDLHLSGPLGKNMVPVFTVLDGKGSLRTSTLALQGVPVLAKVADALKVERLRNPALDSVRTAIQIHDGRVQVNPFDVRIAQSMMRVSGSHGIDQTMQYTLGLRMPRSELGAAANQVVAGLVSRAGKTGIDLQAADTIGIEVRIGGTLTSPTIQTNLGDVVASAGQSVKQAAQEATAAKVDSLKERADSAAAEARRKAQAEADRVIAEAEQRAAAIREEAKRVADNVRREANARADTLVAKATNPLAKAAAQAAADRVKKEANNRADQIVREGDKRADDLVAEARRKANSLLPAAKSTTP